MLHESRQYYNTTCVPKAILEEAPLIEVRDSNPEDPDECSQAQDYLSFLLDRMSDTQVNSYSYSNIPRTVHTVYSPFNHPTRLTETLYPLSLPAHP